MAGFLVLLSMVAFVTAAVSLFRPFPRLGLATKARSAMAVVGSFLLFGVAGAMLPPVPPEPAAVPAPEVAAPPVSIASADKAIQSVVAEGDTLVVTAKLSTAWNAQQYVDFAALTVQAVGKAMQAGAPEAAASQKIRFVFLVPSTDRLGNETTSGLGAMVFDASDLRAAHFENLSLDRTLNLATVVVPGIQGREAIGLWCSEDAHRDGRNFCVEALS